MPDFVVSSPKRTDQLLRLVDRLEVKRKMCLARVERMKYISDEGKLDYYTRWGFDSDEEQAEADQAARASDRALKLLGMA